MKKFLPDVGTFTRTVLVRISARRYETRKKFNASLTQRPEKFEMDGKVWKMLC